MFVLHAFLATQLLTIGLAQEPDTLHPVITTMTASNAVRHMAIRPLAAVNEVWKWECYLCTTIPTIENGGAKVLDEGGTKKILVSWEIKADAVWGDGQPVTGNDMKLAWQIGMAPTVTKGAPESFDGVEEIVVDAKNPKRFTMKYKALRYDYNQLDLSFVPLPSHIEGPIFEKTKGEQGAYEKQTSYIVDPTNPGLYNGPYRVKEIKPSSHVLLEKNPKFAGQAAAFPQILFKIIPNTQALEANILAGSIDMTGAVGVTFDQALAFRKRQKSDPALAKRFRVATMEDLIFEHVDFNLRDPIVADLKVRQALTLAVDRTKLCDALFDGLQKPAAHAYHPLSPYYAKGDGDFTADVKKAEALLDEAGWKKGEGGIRTKDGKKLALSIMTTSQNKVRELVQVYLQEAWKKVGVELSIKNEPARVFFGGTLKRGEYGQLGMYASTFASPDDIQLQTFSSTRIPTAANGYAGSNYMAWSNATADQALAAAQVSLDPVARTKLVRSAIAEYIKELPQLPLYYRAAVVIAPLALVTNQDGGVDYPLGLRVERWTWKESVTH